MQAHDWRLQDCRWDPSSTPHGRYLTEKGAAAKLKRLKEAPKILSKTLFKFKNQLSTYHYWIVLDLNCDF